MTNPYKIEPITTAYTDADWKNYFSFRLECSKQQNIPLPYESWEKLRDRNLEWLTEGNATYKIWKEGKAAGFFSFRLSSKDQAEKRYVYSYNNLIQPILNKNILQLIFQAFIDYDPLSNFLIIRSNNEENAFIEDYIQAEVKANSLLFELLVKDCSMELIDQWLADGNKRFTHYTPKFYEQIPDHLLEEYCQLFTTLLNDMPANSEVGDLNITPEIIRRNEANNKKNNSTVYRYVIFNEKNQMIAKTIVWIDKNKAQTGFQYMTGVLKDYRKQGLSKWVKALMFKKLTKDFPTLEKIKSGTHPDNLATQKVSLQIGYKQVGSKKEYAITKDNILLMLEKSVD